MFSQKKKNRTWLYACIALTLAILAVFSLIGLITGNAREEIARTNSDSQVETGQSQQVQTAPAPQKEIVEEEENEKEQFYQSYYLVKYDKNVIKIFFSDETGRMTQLEETTIVYETLSAQDQQRFEEGIKLENRDDLNRLIMDYES